MERSADCGRTEMRASLKGEGEGVEVGGHALSAHFSKQVEGMEEVIVECVSPDEGVEVEG